MRCFMKKMLLGAVLFQRKHGVIFHPSVGGWLHDMAVV
nr:MAG TPA: hypothetical protein [Caudoviricetes sp.]